MNLGDVFTSIAYKELVQVDLPEGSNQHEINVNRSMKEFFRTSDKITCQIQWYYFSDNKETIHNTYSVTFYDSRARGAHLTGRSEFRLYYEGDFLRTASSGDVLVLAQTATDEIYGLVFQKDSAWLSAVTALFQLGGATRKYKVVSEDTLNNQDLELAGRILLEELGIESTLEPALNDEALMLENFGKIFPSTKIMTDFARAQISELNPFESDIALIALLEREEQLFRALERVLVQEKLDQGFESVEEFIEYSKSVQNRRKSRMGHSLQHHLAFLFQENGLKFKPQGTTEHKNKPDFLFPGELEYRNPAFDAAHLFMLAAKSTAKDRWRQILTEANRIPKKHLCTLEQAISRDQTDEMRRKGVYLVVPASFHSTYLPIQQRELLSLHSFIELVRERQSLGS